jgi:hypothetical protein
VLLDPLGYRKRIVSSRSSNATSGQVRLKAAHFPITTTGVFLWVVGIQMTTLITVAAGLFAVVAKLIPQSLSLIPHVVRSRDDDPKRERSAAFQRQILSILSPSAGSFLEVDALHGRDL